MTKQNIEIAIRKYLNEHLDLLPDVIHKELFDIRIERICISENAYTGKKWYNFTGKGEGWIRTETGKNFKRFQIVPSKVYISGDEEPLVEDISNPLLVEIIS